MPTLTIELAPGRTAEQKIKYAEEVTKLTSDILKCPVDSIDIIFVEIPSSNWVKGGKFLAPPV
ncbi:MULTISPECIES: 4-oxalocrotonate tautomerase [unclassified Herbaspirillum]|uniref:4-oxalocrotonate tautomerase n=1 Tax=Bacteria TaxID=2 RepID=UPI000E2F3ABB|nr:MULTISPECIES: 4-oxalocrotonate tautomerase [unclassified Herbaspirillum]THA41357.1 4-oxalocrotonate tautomerase [Streptomyces sp. A1136]RFB71183.1 4-oxalocrotonate tautomerase [Herbaspirillum sp. 3R-3a1]TFI08280.1 4-oxalocrotonate tautomerase [Herbaspirillum sp. 3R11]TFI14695.1 4-oxalocrotonate tautomerase [Herbaspirillum sp. 3R-11]TFI31913.1 4-oxalocrotonate tautomerase [Herbaspirillum sp. 3C11]